MHGPAAGGQRGIVLFVALIVLIVMSLAGLALLRQMGVGNSIAGNLAFKENATSVADRGVEEARLWVISNGPLEDSDVLAAGYHSTWDPAFDPMTYDWTVGTKVANADQAQTGNGARYIIHRLCETADMSPVDPAQKCSDSVANNTGASHGGGNYGNVPATPIPSPFFRITTRVDGPRNTVSFTQVLIQ
ncbi:MAG: hypothetical protein ABI641_07165 [Caldimonas sp.]